MMWLRGFVFVVAAFLLNFPVIAILVTSFKTPAEIASNPGFFVQAPTLMHYIQILSDISRFNIYAYLFNSTVAAFMGSVFALMLALPAAYAMVRCETGRRYLLPLIANLRAVPLVVFAIPLYMMFQLAGLLDTRLGLGLVLTIVNLPLILVLMVNAIAQMPVEIDEAARLDRARVVTILLVIVRPVIFPAIVTAFIFGFITGWNEYLFGLMLTTRHGVPVTVGASFFFSASGGGVQWGAACAVMVIGALPPVILGMFFYRHLATLFSSTMGRK